MCVHPRPFAARLFFVPFVSFVVRSFRVSASLRESPFPGASIDSRGAFPTLEGEGGTS